jgi:sulfite reductase (NADPH) flavoprotein alpha-component
MTSPITADLPPRLDHPKLREIIGEAKALNAEQLLWCSGYLAGIAAGNEPASAPESGGKVVIMYASQTGNGVGVAKKLQQSLAQAGINAGVFNALDYRKAQLKKATTLLLIASTHGEGDVPDTAQEFAEFLQSDKAKTLKSLDYSVLALGDSSYSFYCQVGQDFDTRLGESGASELLPLQECDVDYGAAAATWITTLTDKLQATQETTSVAAGVSDIATSVSNDYSREQPWHAEVLANQVITARGSTKQVRHLELSLEDSGMEFLPGDSIAIIAPNPLPLVEQILQSTQLDPEIPVISPAGGTIALQDALVNHYEIAPLAPPVVHSYSKLLVDAELTTVTNDERKQQLTEWLYGRDLLDLLKDHPVSGLGAEQLIAMLRPRQPRLYSVASSPAANPDEVHLTVATVEYEARNRRRFGTTTGWLAANVEAGQKIEIYRHDNPLFRLPDDPDQPVIMIGPGTGVAPFRAFMEQRETLGAQGRNWLFFGDRNFTTDFLYQREWQAHRASGLLTRIDLAFSRDQSTRIYVQQRMLEQSKELYRWLESGACVYVCGDAGQMAADVHSALLEIIQKEGALSPESAADYVSQMQRERRYQRDVY